MKTSLPVRFVGAAALVLAITPCFAQPDGPPPVDSSEIGTEGAVTSNRNAWSLFYLHGVRSRILGRREAVRRGALPRASRALEHGYCRPFDGRCPYARDRDERSGFRRPATHFCSRARSVRSTCSGITDSTSSIESRRAAIRGSIGVSISTFSRPSCSTSRAPATDGPVREQEDRVSRDSSREYRPELRRDR